jgi:aspartyl-tRNA(Asn)/glutamyl-tRNA(Gln) amidotransferase subunit C
MSTEKAGFDVGYVAELARIALDDKAKERFQADMDAIVSYIEQLSELDVEGIEPTAHAVPLSNVWREDATGDAFPRETLLENAPELLDDELVKVPRVLPGEGMS